MLLRLIAYLALGVDAVMKHQYLLAVLCFGTPFAGPVGMFTATLAGILFFIQGYYIEGAVSVGVVILNLIGNHAWGRVSATKRCGGDNIMGE